LKVQITSSFGVPGCTPFAVGEELDVPRKTAEGWINTGRAVALEAEPVAVSEPPISIEKPKRKQNR
jgi:hypothetical protein